MILLFESFYQACRLAVEGVTTGAKTHGLAWISDQKLRLSDQYSLFCLCGL